MNDNERRYAALAPVLAIAGVFIHPMASVLLPLAVFIILHRLGRQESATIALRAADLVFTAQLLIIIASLLTALAYNMFRLSPETAQTVYYTANIVILAYLVASLAYASMFAFRGHVLRYTLSFRLAERLFTIYQARKKTG